MEKQEIRCRKNCNRAEAPFRWSLCAVYEEKYSSAGYEACKVMKDTVKLMLLLIHTKGVKKKTAYQIIMQVKDFLNLLDEKLIKNQR